MTSTFVKRAQAGRNHTVSRVEVPGLPPVQYDAAAAALAAQTSALRANRWTMHVGLERAAATTIDRLTIDPCPAQDFNGADFLYFASFQAFVDRAEWGYFRSREPLLTTRQRDIVYRANIDAGERVVVTLQALRRDKGALTHWYRLEREQDGVAIADAFSVRQPSALG
jgi:probable biosynthetic protein (TIGR04099 family)